MRRGGACHPTLPFSAFAAHRVRREARPGLVISPHDARGQPTATALERILPALRRRGVLTPTPSELVAAAGDSSVARKRDER